MKSDFEKAKEFIYRNARPIDIARWKYHFESGNKENVLRALSYYQNTDGGFGNALEADSWNPNSSPIQTWCATEILREIDFTDNQHPIIKGILQYLDSGADFNGHLWYTAVRSNNDYPHAPWWHTESDSTCHNDYNPTACFTGFALAHTPKDSRLYKTALSIAIEAVDTYLRQGLLKDMHTVLCYIRLMEYCENKGIIKLFDIAALKAKLIEQVKTSITQNIEEWETGYVCKPSQFFNTNNSIFYADNKDIAEYECEYICKTQLDNGSWNIPWSWADYPEEWAVSKNWWKSNGIILNMLYLRGFNKLF